MKYWILLVLFFSSIPSLISQSYNPNQPPNTFRSADNPHYWKNKKPYEDYWQQDVYYTIEANVDEQADIIEGTMELVYWNNSPDTLEHAFFHLFQNAFEPGSYYSNLRQNNHKQNKYGQYTSQQLGTEIKSLEDAQQELSYTIDNTIMKVELNEPLPPNASMTFNIEFNTYFDNGGNIRRRMKTFNSWGYKHYDGVHWYPSIAVYDRKFGWTTDQHLGREFYHNFGTFDVELTFANHMIVEATGTLQNEEAVLPDSLRDTLDIRNYFNKPWKSEPSVIIPYDSTAPRKTWYYYAENVHNFAFTADPTYRLGSMEVDGVTITAAVQEPHAPGWRTAVPYTAGVVVTNQQLAGDYAWPKIVVADARDGMEYPMLTLDGGFDPYYRDLIAHEVSHMWFYGMVGNNETYRASMDEGFTQFLSTETMRRLDGEKVPYPMGHHWYTKKFKNKPDIRDMEVFYGYLNSAKNGNDARLNTHSDDFGGALRHGGGYRHVYYKMGTMLYNLQYVLGKELFWDAFRHYFDQWSFAHPYFEDFRQSIIDYTGVDLNWFFDQWLETTEKIDYAIKSVKQGNDDGEYEVTFKRKGQMQMPIDFRVITTADTFDYHIPNTWFEKETDATVLPKWIGWGSKLQPEYTANIEVDGRVKNVIIDPSGRLADVYQLDNQKQCPIDLSFDAEIGQPTNYKSYFLRWRPDAWYNSYDGIKAGLHLEGDYWGKFHDFNLTAWYNTGLVQNSYYSEEDAISENAISEYDKWSFNFNYRTMVPWLSRKTFVNVEAARLDGLDRYKIGLESSLNKKMDVSLDVQSLFRGSPYDLNYLLYPDLWEAAKYNTSLKAQMDYNYRYSFGRGDINVTIRSPFLLSDYDYSYLQLESINKNRLGKLDIKTRVFGRFGTGTSTPPASALYASMASPEEMMQNKYTRAAGIVPLEWTGFGETTNHFQHGGGLNLRGYSGYYMVQTGRDGNPYLLNQGQSGMAANVEIEFDKLVNFNPGFLRAFHLDTYLFGDAGTMVYEEDDGQQYLSDVRFDAGVGAALKIKRFWKLETVQPLTLRVDFPLLLSHTPNAEPDFLQFRWLVGIERAF